MEWKGRKYLISDCNWNFIRGRMTRQSLSVAIIEAIADVEGEAPTELDYRLHDYIDTTAIEKLGAHGGDWTLRFTVADHVVLIESGGTFSVDGNEYEWKEDSQESKRSAD